MRTIATAGLEMPVLGFGTWKLKGDLCRRAVADALALGYRHIDTAVLYDNEREVGEAIREAPVSRDQLFVTTKVWRESLGEADVRSTIEGSLQRLGLDRVDLVLIHWPNADIPLTETLRGLNAALRDGLTRAVGVSNFNSRLLEEATALSDAPIATNQVEYHPYLSQARLLETQRRLGVPLTAYCPLAQGRVTQDPALQRLAAARGVGVGPLVLGWLIGQEGVIAIPKTSSRDRAAENLRALDIELTPEEMAQIAALARPDGRTINTEWVKWD